MIKKRKEKLQILERQNVALFLVVLLLLQSLTVQSQESPVEEIEEIQNIVIGSNEIILAQEYIASNPAEATEIARSLNFLPNSDWEDPSNMCGPLSGSILFRSNIWHPNMIGEENFDAHNFWKLNPNDLPNIFPANSFSQFEINESIWNIDFSVYPIELGDFMYLEGGSFDHMLVITKIERTTNGIRAYSVTNIHTEAGFVIQEILLFDTADDNAGYFRNQFRSTNSWTGQTGANTLHMYRRATAIE